MDTDDAINRSARLAEEVGCRFDEDNVEVSYFIFEAARPFLIYFNLRTPWNA